MENRTGDKSARRTQRDYPLEFKEKVVREFESTDLSLSAISRKYGIQGESTVRRWLERYGTLNPEDAVLDRRFRSRGSLAGLEQKIVSLEQRIARLEDKVAEDALKAASLDALVALLGEKCHLEIRKVAEE